MRSAPRALLAVWLVLAALAGRPLAAREAAPPEEPPARTYGEAIDVSLLTLTLRVVDTWGNPILGLAPEDFRVAVGKREVAVRAIDWVGARQAGAASAATGEGATPSDGRGQAPPLHPEEEGEQAGRLVVVFVQADLHPSRIGGQMRLRPFTRQLLGAAQPGDRFAVVSYDSHLKVWQDFAADVEATHAAIDRAMLFSPERTLSPAPAPSLAAHLDRAAARGAASPERALELVARAMGRLPGEKTLLFVGWGLGRYSSWGVQMTPGYHRAVGALRDARATVFVLDVTSAEAHSLAVGLESVAAATGGLYFSTYRLPQLATATLARVLAGYYVLTLDLADGSAGSGEVRVELRGRRGTVLTRPVILR